MLGLWIFTVWILLFRHLFERMEIMKLLNKCWLLPNATEISRNTLIKNWIIFNSEKFDLLIAVFLYLSHEDHLAHVCTSYLKMSDESNFNDLVGSSIYHESFTKTKEDECDLGGQMRVVTWILLRMWTPELVVDKYSQQFVKYRE